jgi:hypothetical protein
MAMRREYQMHKDRAYVVQAENALLRQKVEQKDQEIGLLNEREEALKKQNDTVIRAFEEKENSLSQHTHSLILLNEHLKEEIKEIDLKMQKALLEKDKVIMELREESELKSIEIN